MTADRTPGVSEPTTIVLFRSDLRLLDNRALSAAAARGRVLALYLHNDNGRPLGSASQWWRHHSLASLAADIQGLGGQLHVRTGPAQQHLPAIIETCKANAVFWNRRYNPSEAKADAALKQHLRGEGILAESFDGQLLHEPTQTKTGAGGAYKVFGAFQRAVAAQEPRDPVDMPDHIIWSDAELETQSLASP